MKNVLKIAGIFCAFVMMSVMSGCKSTPLYVADYAPVVVLSVVGNPNMPWDLESYENKDMEEDYDETGKDLITGTINKFLQRNNPEYALAQDRVDYAAQALNDLFDLTAGVEVVPHDKLQSSETYEDASKNVFDYLETSYVATGYKSLNRTGSKKARMIMSEIGARSMVMTEFLFQKTIVKGTHVSGSIGVKVSMKMRYLDENGKEKVNKDFVAVSSDSVKIKNRKYDKDALCQLVNPTVDQVINAFLVNYIK